MTFVLPNILLGTCGDLGFCDASFYLVRVTAPEKLVVVASGIEVGREHEGDDQILTFAAGPAASDSLGPAIAPVEARTEPNPAAPTVLRKFLLSIVFCFSFIVSNSKIIILAKFQAKPAFLIAMPQVEYHIHRKIQSFQPPKVAKSY